ncbi:MAG: 4Fe-4S binding protein [Deltaproteobacteria bacterium]|nr:MAG: 4Fe-4S binding protein [Deltaproteobacteria bacterium]
MAGKPETVECDLAYVLIGFEPPVDFLKRQGIRFEGTFDAVRALQFLLVAGLVYFVYGVKNGLRPFDGIYRYLAEARVEPGFLYGLLYSVLMSWFGMKALARWGHDPYQRKRYTVLIAAQWIVYFAVPWALWYLAGYPHYWRTWAVTLTYPLGYYGIWEPAPTLFSDSLLPWTIAALAAFLVFMPIFSFFHGKRFCAWFCPCGGLADTFGDRWRHCAPRGKKVRTVEIASTVVFVVTVLCSVYLVAGYRDFLTPERLKSTYKTVIDIGLASLVALTLYPFAGGRIWCRFFCPLAKWMEWWGRIGKGRLRIVANDECISCGECTRYCQMGIDVRAFAQRQLPLSNETTCCIFCGICVTVCPVDVLRLERKRGRNLQDG